MKILLGEGVKIDLDKLIETRLLIQANSGGGKSYTIRRLIEQSFGKKQIIVIDPEGEFGNLRSKFDFVYCGKDGDAAVQSRTAELLAHRLLELKASAIIDLYELPPQERKRYVRLFCNALVNAPKELWQDVLVIIDEAHVFAPEKGESEALGAVIDLASRGRKRGFCAVLATQRPAKLSKDAAAECNNKLIGRASLDIDRKRSAEELGFTTREQILSLRDLDPGEFYVFGPAIGRDVTKTKIGDVRVKPPKRGVSKGSVPAPSGKVRHILSKLADLPAEAQKEATTVAELKGEISTLKQQLRQNPQKIVENDPKVVEKAVERAIRERDAEWSPKIGEAVSEVNRFRKIVQGIAKLVGAHVNVEHYIVQGPPRIEKHHDHMPPTPPKKPVVTSSKKVSTPATKWTPPSSSDQEFVLTGPEQRILDAIALSESIGISEPEQTAVAFLAGYTYGGGGFNNPRGALKTKGLVEYRGSRIALTDTGRNSASVPEKPLTGEMLREKVLSILPGPEQKLLRPLFDAYPEVISNEELSAASGYALGSGGFNNPRGRLRTLGLIEYVSGKSRAKDFLFP